MAGKDNRGKKNDKKVKAVPKNKFAAKIAQTGKNLKNFFANMKAELKRVVWPDRKRLIQSTATVLAICVIAGIILFVVDSVVGGILEGIGFYAPN